MNRPLSKLERRIIDISFKHKLSHLSSCLTAVNMIDNIYKVKKDDEPFILSNGHAGLALYVVLEKVYLKDAEKLLGKHGIHPCYDPENRIWVSTGSLGQGLPIAVGMALADRNKNVWVMCSDGEMAEGSMWEALRIAGERRLENLKVTINANGTGAYGKIDQQLLDMRIQLFYPSLVIRSNMYEFIDSLQGLDGHYHALTEDDYKELTKYG